MAARVLASHGPGPSLAWGMRERVSPPDAAAIKGTARHALDYDDCNNTLAGQPLVPLLPALIALGESLGSSGKDVLLAYITGFEAQSHIASAVHLHHYGKGWHPTSTLGIFGAAAGSARLLGLDAQRTATALAIAVSLASGVKANFGTMTKQGIVNVTTIDGKRYSARVDQPLRGPQNLAPPDQLGPRFRDCAARTLRSEAISPLLEMLRTFESLADIREFSQHLASAVRHGGAGP